MRGKLGDCRLGLSNLSGRFTLVFRERSDALSANLSLNTRRTNSDALALEVGFPDLVGLFQRERHVVSVLLALIADVAGVCHGVASSYVTVR